jgi:hypothetical protein
MANVIRRWNDANHAVTLSGHTVERKEVIYLKSHQNAYPVLPTSMHFVYYDPTVPRGSTLLCTCGASAGVFNYDAYKKWTSRYFGNEVICCTEFIQQGKHGDGSHE